MSAIRLYRQNVYQKEAAAHITAMDEYRGHALVTLDQTIFFPAGGGQSCDKGTLAGYPVLDVYEKGGEVFHLIDCKPADLPAPQENTEVQLLLDTYERSLFIKAMRTF